MVPAAPSSSRISSFYSSRSELPSQSITISQPTAISGDFLFIYSFYEISWMKSVSQTNVSLLIRTLVWVNVGCVPLMVCSWLLSLLNASEHAPLVTLGLAFLLPLHSSVLLASQAATSPAVRRLVLRLAGKKIPEPTAPPPSVSLIDLLKKYINNLWMAVAQGSSSSDERSLHFLFTFFLILLSFFKHFFLR